MTTIVLKCVSLLLFLFISLNLSKKLNVNQYERIQPVSLISLSCNWEILHNEIDQIQVKIK